MQALEPLTVEHVRLATRDVLELPRIDELDVNAALAEELEERNPVHAGRLHGHCVDPTGHQPGGQRVKVGGTRPEFADVLAVRITVLRNGHMMPGRADIDPSSIQIHAAKLLRQSGGAAIRRRPA